MTAQAAQTETQDDALMAQVAARSGDAFRALAGLYGEIPYRIGWRMLGDATEAEDIAQEAMLRLWDQAPRWRAGGAGIAAWLKRVAMNLCLDRLRRRKFGSDDAVPDRADESPLADSMMEEAQLAARTKAAIGTLSEHQRAAIVLTYYEELSNMAAAETLAMNIKAFESLLLRARSSLRKALEADGVVAPFSGGGS